MGHGDAQTPRRGDAGTDNQPPVTSHQPPNIRLELGDCIAGMAELPAGSVDVVVTSPPYNLGIRYDGFDDTAPRDEYLAWTERWAAEVKRVLAPDGSFFLNVGAKPTDPLVPFQVLARLVGAGLDLSPASSVGAGLRPARGSPASSVAAGPRPARREPLFVLQNTLHWVKSIAVMQDEVGNYPGMTEDLVVGHYKPINSQRFLNDCHEYIFHLTHRGDVKLDRLAIGVPYRDKSNVKRWSGGQDLHCRGNTWFLPYETIQRRDQERPHPATFPVELPTRCLRLHGLDRVRTALDPFLGLGSTAVAAIRLGVDCIGFECVSEYLEHARERVEQELRTSS